MNYYLTQSGYSSASHLLILRLNYRGATSHVISRHRIPFLTITKECPSPILITTTCKICKQTWSNRGVVGQTEYQVSAALSSVYQGIMGISECATQHNCCRASGLVNAAIWLAVGGGGCCDPTRPWPGLPPGTQSWRSKRRENKVLLHHRRARRAVMWTLLIPLKLLNKQFEHWSLRHLPMAETLFCWQPISLRCPPPLWSTWEWLMLYWLTLFTLSGFDRNCSGSGKRTRVNPSRKSPPKNVASPTVVTADCMNGTVRLFHCLLTFTSALSGLIITTCQDTPPIIDRYRTDNVH